MACWAAVETPSAGGAGGAGWAGEPVWRRASRRRPVVRRPRLPPDDDQRRLAAAKHLERARTAGDSERRAREFFRAGEQLRAAGAAASAARAFRAAAATGRIPWVCRSLLELAHLERRAGRLETALEVYQSTSEHSDAATALRDVARGWSARTLEALGRPAEAERLWKSLSTLAQRPLQRVRAYDHLACLCQAREDYDGAHEVLEQCDASLSALASQCTPQGDSLRGALARMRSRGRTPRTPELTRDVASGER